MIGAMARYGARTISQHKNSNATEATSDAVVLIDRLNRSVALLDRFHGILHGGTASEDFALIKANLPTYGKSIAVYQIREEILRVAKAALGPRWRRTKSLGLMLVVDPRSFFLSRPSDIIQAVRDFLTTAKLHNALKKDIINLVGKVETAYKTNDSNKAEIEDKAWKTMRALVNTAITTLEEVTK